MMFWLKKLKDEQDQGSSWILPYGDLMSLLLAIFVMIAAMSELRAGQRFETVRQGVRSAFGFQGDASAGLLSPKAPTLFERLERVGLQRTLSRANQVDDEGFVSCQAVRTGSEVMIRLAGGQMFETFQARLTPPADRTLERIADYLKQGQAAIVVRGHSDDGPLPGDSSFRDAWDLSYERARAVADRLVRCGVARHRLRVDACGDSDPLDRRAKAADGTNRRVEIIVSAVPIGQND